MNYPFNTTLYVVFALYLHFFLLPLWCFWKSLDLGRLLFVWQLFSDRAYVDHIKNGMFCYYTESDVTGMTLGQRTGSAFIWTAPPMRTISSIVQVGAPAHSQSPAFLCALQNIHSGLLACILTVGWMHAVYYLCHQFRTYAATIRSKGRGFWGKCASWRWNFLPLLASLLVWPSSGLVTPGLWVKLTPKTP